MIMKIDISICPSSLQFANGDTYDGEKLCESIYKFCKEQHPSAEINVQVGHRQGHEWATIDGDDDSGSDLLTDFFMKHGHEDELFIHN